MATAALLLAMAASAGATTTIVTLGFDDGLLSQYNHRSILAAHGVKATFFLNSGKVGNPDTMSYAQMAQLEAEGHELGGHTVDHANLPTLTTAQQQHQVCDDRTTLLSHGFDIKNFAYPFGAWNAAVKTVVQGCGYTTARTTGGTDWPEGPVYAETIPPPSPFTLRAIQPRYDTGLATYQDIVDKARFSTGGWVNIVLHGVCDDPCAGHDDYDTPASRLDAFLGWLGTLPDVNVRTTAQALASTADVAAPTVALTAPADGATVTGTVPLTADASDNVAVDHVDFLVGGSVVGSDASEPYRYDWDSTSAGAGASITARAIDTFGNQATSTAHTVTVAHPSPTTITLSFDDGLASQYAHRAILEDHGVDATFYVNSGTVDAAGHVTWAQVADLKAAGHEIGGHTLDDVSLPSVATAEQQHQVCDDRQLLIQHSIDARNFAYPFGAWDAAVGSVVSGCGYASARTTGGLDWPGGPLFAETLPPLDALSLRAVEPSFATDLAALQDIVDSARYSGGGWVNIALHGICDDPCTSHGDQDMPASRLQAFLDWAGAQSGVTFKTTRQALNQPNDTSAPTVSIASPTAAANVSGTVTITANAADNIGVSRVDFIANGVVKGSDTTAPYTYAWNSVGAPGSSTIAARAVDPSGNTTTTAARTVHVLPVDTTKPTVALTKPASGATLTGVTTLTATATDNVAVAKVEFLIDGAVVGTDTTAPYSVDWDSSNAGSSVSVTARATDTNANVQTSAARTAVVADVLFPTAALTTPEEGATVSGTTTLAGTASDNRGVTRVDFLINGAVAGSDTSEPYSINWSSSSSAATVTVALRARDAAGHVSTTPARTANVADVVAPTVALTSPANLSTVTGIVTIAANASDNRGIAGVDFYVGTTIVGTDTTAPYSFAWNSAGAGSSATLKARARDTSGNTTISTSRTVTVTH